MKNSIKNVEENKEVSFIGLALNSKGYAVIKLEDQNVIYIPTLSSWDDKYFKKTVIITGTFKEIKLIPDPYIDERGGISQGAFGSQYILENIKEIKLLD